jgi:hypothetical protein
MHVMFQLREPLNDGAATTPTEAGARVAEIKALQARLEAIEMAMRERQRARANGDEIARMNQEASKLRQQVAMLERTTPSARGRSVIDTSFNMDVGETVVVGTSHVRGGDKALIALLTAVAKRNAQKE